MDVGLVPRVNREVTQGTSFDGAPRSTLRLISGAFGLYRGYPLLFFVLAVGVVVPYELIVLAATGTGPFTQSTLSFGVSSLLDAISWLVIGPLVSALHIHAVAEIRERGEPRLVSIARQGLLVLPVVAAAAVMSGLGITLGFLALIVPGVFLWLRWSVVSQCAAIEHDGWLPALRRSKQLTKGRYPYVLLFQIVTSVIVFVPTLLLGHLFGHHSTTAASFLVGVLVRVFSLSFTALATALLYFDLRLRYEHSGGREVDSHGDPDSPDRTASGQPNGLSSRAASSWDPRDYSEHERPPGWYIDPESPARMRYWRGGDSPAWVRTTRTPKKLRRAWRETGND